MKTTTKAVPMLAALAALLCAPALVAQEGQQDWTYAVGLRSTLMVTDMPLSALGAGFEDLPAGGEALPHASSLFVMWRVSDHVRLGVETLVGNSYAKGDTDILFQASGITAEVQTGGTWFAAASVQAGGMLASATHAAGGDEEDVLRTGARYKNSGLFVAPQVGLGRRVGRLDLRLIAKQVWQLGGENLDAFDARYVGISVGVLR